MRSTKLVPLLAMGLLLVAGCRDQVPPLAPDDAALAVAENAGKGPQVQPPRVGEYAFQQIDAVFPGEETRNTEARGINARGDVVGVYQVRVEAGSPWRYRGFFLSGGEFHQIHYPGALNSYPDGINDRGDVIGHWSDGTRVRGFLLRGGDYTSIEAPNATLTRMRDINARGSITGEWRDAAGAFRGYVLRDGEFTLFEVPGAIATYPKGINDSGTIVGYYTAAGRSWPFVRFPDGTISTDMEYPEPHRFSVVVGINAGGEIVGYFGPQPPPPAYLGFVLDKHGSYTRLETPLAPNNIPEAISPRGVIVGTLWWYVGGGVWTSSGFVAKPLNPAGR